MIGLPCCNCRLVDVTPLNRDAFLALCVRLWDFLVHQKRVQELDFFLARCSDQVSRKHFPSHIIVEPCMFSSSIGSSSCPVKCGPTEHKILHATDLQLRSETLQDCQPQVVLTVMFRPCPVFTENVQVRLRCIKSLSAIQSPFAQGTFSRSKLWHTNRCGSSRHRLTFQNAGENTEKLHGLRIPSMTRFLGTVHEGGSCGRPPVRDTSARLPPDASKSACASLRAAFCPSKRFCPTSSFGRMVSLSLNASAS